MGGLFNKSLIPSLDVYLNIKDRMVNIGGVNESALNKSHSFVPYQSRGSNWIIMVHDIRFNSSTAIN
jgi:hypothetical protein